MVDFIKKYYQNIAIMFAVVLVISIVNIGLRIDDTDKLEKGYHEGIVSEKVVDESKLIKNQYYIKIDIEDFKSVVQKINIEDYINTNLGDKVYLLGDISKDGSLIIHRVSFDENKLTNYKKIK